MLGEKEPLSREYIWQICGGTRLCVPMPIGWQFTHSDVDGAFHYVFSSQHIHVVAEQTGLVVDVEPQSVRQITMELYDLVASFVHDVVPFPPAGEIVIDQDDKFVRATGEFESREPAMYVQEEEPNYVAPVYLRLLGVGVKRTGTMYRSVFTTPYHRRKKDRKLAEIMLREMRIDPSI